MIKGNIHGYGELFERVEDAQDLGRFADLLATVYPDLREQIDSTMFDFHETDDVLGVDTTQEAYARLSQHFIDRPDILLTTDSGPRTTQSVVPRTTQTRVNRLKKHRLLETNARQQSESDKPTEGLIGYLALGIEKFVNRISNK